MFALLREWPIEEVSFFRKLVADGLEGVLHVVSANEDHFLWSQINFTKKE